jgi:2,3-diaminopropionate biosynthesis protein SbnA
MLTISKTTTLLPPRIAQDFTQAVGSVPIVRLNQVSQQCQQHNLYLKLESCNPGGSIKEKNAICLVSQAEAAGLLQPGGTIVESSSGNFGIALAMVGAVRGYHVKIVIDAKTSSTMRRILSAHGAQLVEVPLTAADSNGSMQVARMQKAQELANTIPGAWYPCQHLNPHNPDAHEIYTAREIESAFNGAPDVIVIGVSTAGQIAGISRYFKQRYPHTKIIGVDVAGSAVFGTPRSPYKMTGLGLSFVPPNFDPSLLDLAYSVSDRIAFSFCHQIAQLEGLLLGASTGAILAGGLAYAQANSNRHLSILMLNPDRGDRYLETVYDRDWLKQNQIELFSKPQLEVEVRKLIPIKVTKTKS